MPGRRVSITIDQGTKDQIVAAAAAEGVSVSAWMTAAAERVLKIEAGLAAIRELQDQMDDLTEEEQEEVRRQVADELLAPPVPPAESRRSA